MMHPPLSSRAINRPDSRTKPTVRMVGGTHVGAIIAGGTACVQWFLSCAMLISAQWCFHGRSLAPLRLSTNGTLGPAYHPSWRVLASGRSPRLSATALPLGPPSSRIEVALGELIRAGDLVVMAACDDGIPARPALSMVNPRQCSSAPSTS